MLSQINLLQTLQSFYSGSILILSLRLLILFTTVFFASYFPAEHCTCFSPLQCLLRVLSANQFAMLPVPLLRQMCRFQVYCCTLPSWFPHGFVVFTMLASFKRLGNINAVSCVTLLFVWEKKLLAEVLCWYHRSDVYAVANRADSRRRSQ